MWYERRARTQSLLRDALGEAQPRDEWPWASHAVTLREIDADLLQSSQHQLAIGELGDGALAHDMADVVDGLDHSTVDRVFGHVLHERAVDLHDGHRHRLEVAERAHAGAEIVQAEAASERLQLLNEACGFVEVGDGCRLRDLEADTGA